MGFNYSFWEKDTFLEDCDYIIIGGGIVGLNAAISLKEQDSRSNVLLIERGGLPLGASSRNAGFACFGSVTELCADLKSSSEDDVYALVAKRMEGIRFLRNRVGDKKLHYQSVGGYEVFDKNVNVLSLYQSKIEQINDKIREVTGLKNAFKIMNHDTKFKDFNQSAIFNQYEGCLHPGEMMKSLYEKATRIGVRFLMGAEVSKVKEHGDFTEVVVNNATISSKKIAICTNGFSKALFPDIDLKPARNQVLVTEKLSSKLINSCYHYHCGYVYFRNIENRILIGGGRHIAMQAETTSEFEVTSQIKSYLKNILTNKLGLPAETKIEYEWSGIMGVGEVKTPILKKQSDNIIFAFRLGGMGIALGAKLGDKAAKLMLKHTT